jgi:hypothetical protein
LQPSFSKSTARSVKKNRPPYFGAVFLSVVRQIRQNRAFLTDTKKYGSKRGRAVFFTSHQNNNRRGEMSAAHCHNREANQIKHKTE